MRSDRVESMTRQRVLFVCTHNSARSQMAEGMLRTWAGDRFEAASAGTEVTTVRPEAIKVMAELGIDITGHHSKSITEFLGQPWDWVITVCDTARQTCPVFPGANQGSHWSFEDPSEAEGTEEERLAVFRRVAREISGRVKEFILSAARPELQDDHPPIELPTR